MKERSKKLKEGTSQTFNVLKEVLGQARFLALFLLTSAFVFLISVWLPNLSFIKYVLTSPALTFFQRLNFLAASLGAIRTNFTLFSQILTVLVSLLFGLNISLVVYHFKKIAAWRKSAGMSLGGIFSGWLGIGCATCGSIILSSIFGVSATASFLGILPLAGQEFGLLSILFLGFSIVLVTRKIKGPLVC